MNNIPQIKIKKLENANGLSLPEYSTKGSAAMDICAAIDNQLILAVNNRVLIPTGLIISLPPNYEAQIRPRSGIALKFGITVLNSPGTIDEDYRGEIKVLLVNLGDKDYVINRGDRIAQLIISPVTKILWKEVNELLDDNTKRGSGGFGSTGF